MPRFQVQVSFENVSLVPKDRSINTFAFQRKSGLVDNFPNVVDQLFDFYTVGDGGAEPNSIWEYLSRRLVQNVDFRIYDIDQPVPRVPVYQEVRDFGARAADAGGLPEEVAGVLSFQGPRVSGEVQARRRGRVYLGPLSIAALVPGSMTQPRPTTRFVAVLAAAGTRLIDASAASLTMEWCVWSRANDEFIPVTNGWTDNAFDTQRRRGIIATVRTAFVGTP